MKALNSIPDTQRCKDSTPGHMHGQQHTLEKSQVATEEQTNYYSGTRKAPQRAQSPQPVPRRNPHPPHAPVPSRLTLPERQHRQRHHHQHRRTGLELVDQAAQVGSHSGGLPAARLQARHGQAKNAQVLVALGVAIETTTFSQIILATFSMNYVDSTRLCSCSCTLQPRANDELCSPHKPLGLH